MESKTTQSCRRPNGPLDWRDFGIKLSAGSEVRDESL
jgi:hypothetical protein